MTTYVTRPLSDRTWLRPANQRTGTRFQSTWAKTLQLLGREVDYLDGRGLVIEVDVTEADLRLDGTIRAKARAASPAVVVAFESKHGPLLYRCDRFVSTYYSQPDDWQQNVRAIALTIEALRAVDRYGASASGEQYRGYRQIEAAPTAMDRATAMKVLRMVARVSDGPLVTPLPRLIERARRNAHPDLNAGDRSGWDQVEAAAKAVSS